MLISKNHIFSGRKVLILFLLYLGLTFGAVVTNAQGNDVLEKRFSFDTRRTTLYNALNIISAHTGYYFIYDSKDVENERKVKLDAKNEPLKSILDGLLKNPNLEYKVISKHILISAKEVHKPHQVVEHKDSLQPIRIHGVIIDMNSQQPLPYVSVAIGGTSLGTITNGDGVFALAVSPHLMQNNLIISHIGYRPYMLPLEFAKDRSLSISLTPEVISLQEVVIRRIDAKDMVEKALKQRNLSYTKNPTYFTTFYREGVQKDNRYLNYSEAVFKIYKQPYSQEFGREQVKEIKSRKLVNRDIADTLVLKVKGGIAANLSLDIVRTLPDFLDEEGMTHYNYALTDIVSYNSRNAYAIGFEQKLGIEDPLYLGTLYIDTDSLTILGADFQINPKYVAKAAEYLIVQRSKTHVVKPERFSYSVTYRKIGSYYFMNHTKCTIALKARKKGRLFSSNFTAFLEMATINVEQNGVVKFDKDEILKPQSIFVDVPYTFDPDFWGDFNIITPEEKLSEALSRINAQITKTE